MICTFYYASEPKFGYTNEENEDALRVPDKSQLEKFVRLSFSIADGATESSYSREWANLLVDAYSRNAFKTTTAKAIIEQLTLQWQGLLETKNLPWYAIEKAEAGAYATFLGITFHPGGGFWSAFAVGDCNLIQIRNSKIIEIFPITKASSFGNTPQLLSSKIQKNRYSESVKTKCYSLQRGDTFFLSTDALAAWLLNNISETPFNVLCDLVMNENKDGFRVWLNEKREAKEIKNDDTTLLLIKFE
jgi:Protein phosphatase 2C